MPQATQQRDPELVRKVFKFGDVEIEYWEGGQGRALLFLHDAGGIDPRSPFLARLARQFRVIAPSHPGFGASSLPLWMDRVADFAQAHLALAAHLDLRDAVLVGASIGGWVAAELVSLNPSRIGEIVLIDPVGVKVGARDKLDLPDIFAMTDQTFASLTYHDVAKSTVDIASKTDDELRVMVRNKETLALVTWEPYMHNPKLKHWLANVTLPTLVVRGESDRLVEDWYAKAYAGLFPRGRLETVSGAGHLPHVEQPDAVAQLITHRADTSEKTRQLA